MQELTPSTIDEFLATKVSQLSVVFFWGLQCPNCEVAKRVLAEYSDQVIELNWRWYHVNTYQHLDLGTRFGLHGIPTFLFFRDGKRIGKMTSFPGWDPFLQVAKSL